MRPRRNCDIVGARARFRIFSPVFEFLRSHQAFLTWLGVFSLVALIASAVLFPLFIARIPEGYFAERKAPPPPWIDAHPAALLAIRIGKNLLGAILILAGIAMLVLPGQGILAIVLGLMLMNFPGKRRMELAMMRNKRVRGALNWIRGKAGRPPLRVYRVEEGGG